MRIAVIGCGWYGAHLARQLLRGGHDVTVFEKDGVFAGASGNNQNRVHQGFHYPRSARTRMEIARCWHRFIAEYPTIPVVSNIYAISKQSNLDFESYMAIMNSAKLQTIAVDPADYGLVNVEGAILTSERVVDVDRAITMFAHLPIVKEEVTTLTKNDQTVQVNQDKHFHACINCSNLQLGQIDQPMYYEAATILNVTGPVDHHSITIMDGDLPTLLATATPGQYTLSKVGLTAVAKCQTFQEAAKVLDCEFPRHPEEFIAAIEEYYPRFSDKFRPLGFTSAVRTKLVNGTDSRECITYVDGRVMHIICGKFMSIYVAEERVKDWLNNLS